MNLTVRTAALGATLAGLIGASQFASGAVPGITGLSGGTLAAPTAAFQLVATEAFSSQPDGGSVYSWGYGCAGAKGAAFGGFVPQAVAAISSCGSMQIPGPTLVVTEGQQVTVSLTNQLPVAAGNTSILFPGFNATASGGVAGVLTQEAGPSNCNTTTTPGCSTVSYTFTAAKPGTYAYYSGTQGDLQVEMGLYGAVIVLPANSASFSNCKSSPNLGSDFRLAAAAFDHPQTCYDREYLFQLAEMQSSIHDEALAQKTACEQALTLNAAAKCPVIAVHSEPYHPNYFLVNGRSMPDDMDSPFAPMYPHQPYNGNPHLHPNEFVLIREIGQGRIQHPLHIHGNHARVLARDGNLLLVPNDTGGLNGSARLAGPLVFTFPTVSGQSVDALFTWTGKGLNWDVYGHDAKNNIATCIPDALGFYTTASGATGSEANYGEYCLDHNKPIPITPPDPQIVANGLWYGGTPYLGLSESAANGFPSTPLPPGTAKQNQSAGYAFMWHSHDEREITTNDVFPGGMMMMLIVDPPASPINEAQ